MAGLLGSRIRVLMEEAGMTRSALARVMGVAPPAVSMWLSGKKNPSASNLKALSAVLAGASSEQELWTELVMLKTEDQLARQTP